MTQRQRLQKDFLDYHHLANPLSAAEWQRKFIHAGLVPEQHIPILPKFNSGIFLLMENLWHVKRSTGEEMGETIFPFLSANQNFPGAFRSVVAGLLEMETDWQDCSGAVFLVRESRGERHETCWCGVNSFLAFSPEYLKCGACGTLVSQNSLSEEQLQVNNDDTDFYGKQYWLDHQQQDFGFPDIYDSLQKRPH